MISLLQSFDLSTISWVLVGLCAIIYGLSKSGIKGIAIIAVPIMAYIFGSKPSTGIVLPMLIIADIMAVFYYNRHARWSYLLKLLPWTLAGILLGTYIGDQLDEYAFKKLMASLIALSVCIMIYWERKKEKQVPAYWWFAAIMGIAAGFTTMVGNVAGGIVTLYLLAMNLPKDQFIGTGAWFFLIINVFKLPLHIFVWNTITTDTVAINFATIPAIALGFVIGVFIIGKFNDKMYRRFALVMTGMAAIVMLIR